MIQSQKIVMPTKFLLIVLMGSTLAISPWTNYDPINLPKLLVLSTVAIASIPLIIPNLMQLMKLSREVKLIALLSFIFVVSMCLSMYSNHSNWSQQFWGTWGRNNGFLSYFSLILIMLLSIIVGAQQKIEKVFRLLVLTGYFVAGYSLLQYMQLDPLPWSQKQPFSFLGNINFMSSMLGFVNVYLFSRSLLEKMPILARLHHITFIIVNTALITYTGSIQGLGITAIGVTFTLFYYIREQFSKIYSLVFLAISVFFGILALGGSAGVGPLGENLRQETVLYRTDYWRAGIRIFMNNLVNGIGIDSLGDFYRQYRDPLAATRTGPGRVVNTSHNVFIDLFATGGLLVGFSFLSLVAIIFFRAFSSSLRSSNVIFKHCTSLILGWIFFLMISINQIGVTIWGFSFLGLAMGAQFANDLAKRSPISNHSSRHQFVDTILLISSSALGFLLAIIPLRADAMFLSGLKQGNKSELEKAAWTIGSSNFHKEKYLETIFTQSRMEDVLTQARAITRANPRSIYAWSVIADASSGATIAERIQAAKVMEGLDPHNSEIKLILRNLISKVEE